MGDWKYTDGDWVDEGPQVVIDNPLHRQQGYYWLHNGRNWLVGRWHGPVTSISRPEHCGRSNEDLECLGCGHKLGLLKDGECPKMRPQIGRDTQGWSISGGSHYYCDNDFKSIGPMIPEPEGLG